MAEIRGIQLIKGDTNLVLEKSVNFLIESLDRHDHNAVAMVNEKLREIIERVGQNIEGRWPFFMENRS